MSLPEPADKPRFVERMFDVVAPRYDFMNRLMTLGVDRSWRRVAVAALDLSAGDVLVDLGCGTGDLCGAGARAGARAIGVDFSGEMLVRARERLPATELVRADAGRLPFAAASIDAVVSGFALRNFARVDTVLSECARVLRPGGRLVLLEVDIPATSAMKAGFDLYFRRVVPMLGRVFSQGYAYRYLAESLAYLPSEKQLADGLERAGFAAVTKRRLGGGAAQVVRAERPRGEHSDACEGAVP